MKKITTHLLFSFVILAYLSFHSLLMAQAPTWIFSKVESSFTEPTTNVFQSQLNITATIDNAGNSNGGQLYFVIYNSIPSPAPTAQQIEQYANGTLAAPGTMVVHDLISLTKDSIAYSKKTIALAENKKYFTYMVSKGSTGLFSPVKFFINYIFKAKKATNSYYYLEYLPVGYVNTTKYPIIIFLHGLNEVGSGITSLSKAAATGLASRISGGKDLPYIAICPQTAINTWDSKVLDRFIEELKAKYPVDLTRIYLTGLSLGGIGTWRYAVRHPDKLAAIIPISGKASDSESMACNISMLPIWAFHDDPDGNVACSGTLNFESRINACAEKITPKVTLFQNLNPDGTAKPVHSIWNTAYSENPSPASTTSRIVVERPAPIADGTTIYSWLESCKRTAVGPVVNVDEDKTIKELSTTISATVSHPESSSTIVSYSWTLFGTIKTPESPTPLPTPVFQGANSPVLSVSNLATATKYIFILTVKDSKGYIDTDEVTITVNQPPVVDCGSDRSLILPVNTTTLSGTTTDSDGTITSCSWGKIGGPAVTMGPTNTNTLALSNMITGVYTFRLTAYDNLGTSAFEDVMVSVSSTAINLPPVVSAGLDKLITLPTNSTTLSGTASDSDGSIASYSWSKISGPAATMVNGNTHALSLSNMLEGVYTFRLTVADNKNATAMDDVIVTVKKAPSERFEAETNYGYPIEATNSTTFGTVGIQQGGGLSNELTVRIFDVGDRFKIYFTVPQTGTYKLNVALRSGGGTEQSKTSYWSGTGGYYLRVNSSAIASFTADSSNLIPSTSYGGSHWGLMKSNNSYSFTTGITYYIEIESNQAWAGVDYLEVINVSGSSSRLANDNTELFSELTNATLYPNPASDKITVDLSGENGEAYVTINSQVGKVYHSSKVKILNGKAEVNIMNIPQGVFILRIDSPKYKNRVLKFVKQ